jgi:hypothetical protein
LRPLENPASGLRPLPCRRKRRISIPETTRRVLSRLKRNQRFPTLHGVVLQKNRTRGKKPERRPGGGRRLLLLPMSCAPSLPFPAKHAGRGSHPPRSPVELALSLLGLPCRASSLKPSRWPIDGPRRNKSDSRRRCGRTWRGARLNRVSARTALRRGVRRRYRAPPKAPRNPKRLARPVIGSRPLPEGPRRSQAAVTSRSFNSTEVRQPDFGA